MEKDSKGSDKKGPKDHGTATTGMDPNLFAHSIFGGAAAAAGFSPMMMSGFPMLPTATSGASSSAAAAHAALASMAGGPAALGSMTQANAAWISFMHQMAAQDYLSRLQSGAAGLHPLAGLGYEALAGMKAATSAGTGSSSTKDSPGGLQLPDGTEIIKHTSSISGPKVPGTTNRGRKKTISLDPPFSAGGGGGLSHGVSSILGRSPATETRLTDSVTITPTSSKSTSDRLRELEMLGTKVGHVSHTASTSGAQVTITPVASKGTTMLTSSVSLTPVERSVAARSPPSTDGPLNLSKKQPAKRRGGTAEPSPYAAALGAQLTPEQQLEQFRSVMASAQQAMSEAGGGGGQRRSRAKKLGVGVSRPKKNTVASLLANSRSSDDGQPGGSSGTLSLSTDELTIEVRPRCSTAPASAADDDDVSVKSAGSDRKHKVTSSTDDPLNSFPYSSYLARLKREYEDSSGLDSEELSAGESECEVSSSKGTPPTKRRRIVTDERKLRAPLERGWRRETTIRKITQAGPRGDVVYYAPCGKAFRQFPDILRYLERNNIGEVTRDHFTFSSKVVIGDYLKISEDGEECIPMSEAEVRRQVDLLCSGKKRQFKKPYVINIKSDESGASGSGSGSGSGGSNFQQAMELMRHLEDERRARQLKEEQRRKEREMKNSQMLEERRRKQEEIEKQKIAESVRKAQELNKQREMLYMLEVERERRRHHMLLVKALDARRRQEERDRRRQDMKEERAALKERRREKRLQDAEMSRELKKPREDMELADQKRLPELKRIPGLKLAGEAFAHCLMVFEFLHNFGETLGFDMESLPSLAALQQGLMNEPDHEEELLSVLTHLVVCAVEDPGIPHPVRHVTLLNQTLRQADVTHNALSEVLRIYMWACASGEVKTLTGLCPNQRDPHCRAKNADFQDAMEGNRTNQISQWLAERPFLALNPTEKIEVLAHLCNDLLQNKAVLRQIESTIEVVNSKRKEKWVLDGRLRRLKMLHSKKFSSRSVAARALPEPGGSDAGDTGDATLLRESVAPKPVDDAKEEEDEDDEKEESGNESEPGDDGDIGVDDGDVNAMTADELLKRIEQLNNHNNQLSRDIFDGNGTIRPTSLGHDRYQRACWVLPRAGGVYVEALESGLGADERYDRRQAALAERRARRSAGEKRTADSPAGQDSKRACVSVSGRDSTVEPADQDSKRACVSVCGLDSTVEPADVTDTPADRLPNGDGVSDVAPRLNGDCAALDGHLRRQWESEPVQARVKMEPAHVKAEPAPGTTEPAPVKVEPVPVKAELTDEMRIQVDSELPEADDFRVEDEPMEAGVHEELTGMDATTAKPEPTETADSAVGSEPAETKADVADTEPAAAGHAVTTEPAEAGDDGASTEPLLAGSSGVKTEPASTPEKPCVRDSLSAIKLLAENPVPASARSSVILSTPTYTPQLNSKHIISYLNASLASLGANGSLREVNGAVQIPGLGLVPSQYLLQALQAPEKLWFSVLPKEPCDFTTIAELSDDEAEWLSAEAPAHSSQHQHDPQDESQPDEPAELQPIPEDCKVGWWRITDPAQIDDLIGALHSRGIRERSLKNRLVTCKEATVEACSMGHPDEVSLPVTDDPTETVSVPPPDAPGSYRRDVALNVEMYLLEHVENLEERIAQASMQVKTWRLPPRTSGDRSLFAPSCAPESDLLDPVASARDRLCDLELNVERRYLKPPLGTSKGADLSLSNLGTEENNTIPRALLVWRDALPRTTTAAQVSMFLYALEMSVAWDKSIMKANCQFCTSGDHEEKLLLCDGCDKGYHTYCFKPAMDAIPDGDWYCYECVNKATGERACVVCGKGEGKVLLCEGCPRAFHPECVTPHVTKVPRGKWHCPACAHKSPKKSRSKKARPAPEPTEPAKPSDSRDTTERPTAPAERESPPKKERGNKKLAKEMAMCKAILAELESHDESWPFLLPVNTKQFPTYKKIIPNPMDLSTIKKRLNESVYKSRDEFLTDMRIIFDNCETFNEDDSPVGKAGHAMRDQFEARWLELSTP